MQPMRLLKIQSGREEKEALPAIAARALIMEPKLVEWRHGATTELCAGRVRREEAADPARKVLGAMEQVVPWARLRAVIQPHYLAGVGAGRPPIRLERRLAPLLSAAVVCAGR